MKHQFRSFIARLCRRLGTKFGIGLITIAPFAVTVGIIYWIFVNIDNLLQPLIEPVLGQTITGLGFVITIALILLLGFIASNVIGKRLINYGESAIPWMPIVHQLYSGIKQIMESFSASRDTSRMQPVLTEFPRKGMRVIGFVTSELTDESGKKLLTVFVPTSPNPTSGFLQIVEEHEVIRTDISLEDALKMVVSAGKVASDDVIQQLFSDSKPATDI